MLTIIYSLYKIPARFLSIFGTGSVLKGLSLSIILNDV